MPGIDYHTKTEAASTQAAAPQNAATRLWQMLARPGIVVAPGIGDDISARCAPEAGSNCMYQSGAATTASRLGQPDLAVDTMNVSENVWKLGICG